MSETHTHHPATKPRRALVELATFVALMAVTAGLITYIVRTEPQDCATVAARFDQTDATYLPQSARERNDACREAK